MAARIDHGRAQLLTRTGLDWTDKYPSAIAALANLNVKTAYIDRELCGVDDAGLPSFANTQAATDGERGVSLVYHAFDLLHVDGWDVAALPLIERKALLEPLIADKPGLQFNGHETGDGELVLRHAGKLGFEGVVSKTINALQAPKRRTKKRAAPKSDLPEQHFGPWKQRWNATKDYRKIILRKAAKPSSLFYVQSDIREKEQGMRKTELRFVGW
jgi:ATP-dependent DNA ligase